MEGIARSTHHSSCCRPGWSWSEERGCLTLCAEAAHGAVTHNLQALQPAMIPGAIPGRAVYARRLVHVHHWGCLCLHGGLGDTAAFLIEFSCPFRFQIDNYI